MNNENKSFCVLPFIHLHVNEHNDIKLCCVADRHPVGKYSPNFNFNADARMQDIRNKMRNGERVEHCQTCYNYEDNGTVSQRMIANKLWEQKLNIETIDKVKTNLVYYDIRNDNLCNLGCRMCGPQSSSQLEKEFEKIGWPVDHPAKSFGFSDVIDLDTVKMIYVSGGEPTLLPKFKAFLENAIAIGKTDFSIQMNTNGTNLNKEFRGLLSNFHIDFISVSVDGYDEINKYIRWPAHWQSIVDNTHSLLEITKNVSFNLTASIWNISNLSKLVLFIEETFIDVGININTVNYPESNVFTTFPNKELALADLQKITELSSTYKYDSNFKTKIDYYITKLEQSTLNLPALTEFFEFNDALDKSRNIKLIDYIPELEECRNYLTKQI